MKPHYFNQDKPDSNDIHLQMAIGQGYVPKGCLLGGMVVMGLINKGDNPCQGCECPRDKCQSKRR